MRLLTGDGTDQRQVNKWSSQPNCDISSATGKMSTEMSAFIYATSYCDGTAEYDAWTLMIGTTTIIYSV